ncbi:putative transcriptional regulator, GntR family [Brachyspira pilosicoli B2904]|uniref:Putative transcriptional regulator, GntR family n=1 Tax=Brachyspira pilosicoli B2904 TaxID=1133568 RepID=J9UTX3_BRAPL|nr:GntR family transcriptional regulator [Brachyspira pilosicoli]AFR70438.1 putative transcriptional regulator, GntR family [Brachyspira pilosicoli B2904]
MLDKNSHVPLYLQIEEIITKNIDDGIWKENDKLPPETLLAKKLGVNRITLREGLNSLIKRGILERVRGVGVFVRNPNKKKFIIGN